MKWEKLSFYSLENKIDFSAFERFYKKFTIFDYLLVRLLNSFFILVKENSMATKNQNM